jgi:UDP-glucose 4-epimerase
MRIAITGSRGFIGGSFGRYAAAAGHEVLGVSRSSQPDADWPGEHLRADSLHSDLAPAFRAWRPEAVLHAAGGASVGESFASPFEDLRAGAMTLANVIDGIRRAGIAPVLLIPSSAAVYGNPATLPIPETGAVAPISPYGFHKAACELLGREAAEILGLRVVICRFFSVYGPRQRRLLVWEVYRQLVSDVNVLEIQGTGSEIRDFLHMDDASAALLTLALRAKRGATIVNVATGSDASVSQLVEEMKRISGIEKMLMCHGASRPGDPRHWEADITRLRELVPGWQPRSLHAGLTETLAQWQSPGRSPNPLA